MKLFIYNSIGVFTGDVVEIEDLYAALPPMSTQQEPPEVGQGMQAVFNGVEWTVQPIPEVVETVPPTPEVPHSITMRQARLQLYKIGKLDDVQAAINALSEPPKTEAQIEWDYAAVVERASPFVALLTPALGLSVEEMDELFIQASKL